MSGRVVLVVSEDDSPDRLDRYLSENIPELSRSRAKEIIIGGLVTVNGSPAKPSASVSPGDTIEAEVPDVPPLEAAPENIPLVILHEDDDIIVVDKPAGMVVHPAPGATSGTLVNALLGHGAGLSGVGGDLRPGIVHRLDRDTSGVVVVAKNDASHRKLSAAFEARAVKKTYLALVWGVFGEEEGTVDEPVGRRRNDRKRMGVVPKGREAVTRWRVREGFPFASLLEVRPETGRTHQIRVHLSHLRRPVMGDADYGGVKSSYGDVPPHYRREAKRLSSLATRQALHARSLRFPHPADGSEMSFVSPLPEDFSALLATLRYPTGEGRRAMALDPGEARVGVAASDEGGILARPLDTLVGLGDEGVAREVGRISHEMDIRVVVVGNPIRMDGTTGARSARARELAAAVEDAAPVRVVLRDERLSSAEAERMMRERGERARGRKGRIDELAASIILQGYLDSRGGAGSSHAE
jgi:23S rRNA pseudouridine1911/1915/1917 synthase